MSARGEGPQRPARRRRLSRSAEFDRVFREGRSHASRHLIVHAFPRAQDEPAGSDLDATAPRLGVSVGRKVGNAVERNRVKRVLREAFWALGPSLPPGHDLVIVARPELSDLVRAGGESAVESDLREVLRRARLIGEASE